MNSIAPTCPQCGKPIAEAEVNVGKGVAYCRRCHLLHDLSELLESAELDFAPELAAPPAGTWLREDGFGTVVGATHRSLGQAAGTLFAMIFCCGIVSVFVTLATLSTLQQFGIAPPSWLPKVTGHGSHNDFPHGGFLIFLWLFLTPFIAICLGLILSFLSTLCGRTEVRFTGADCSVYVGLGPLGYRRRFDPARVRSVKIVAGSWTKNNQPQYVIRMESEGRKPLKFGSMLREDRKRYLAAQVQRLLRGKSGSSGTSSYP
ncbi:MAG TPA: hypothetical protein VGO11_14450 [Chthoniobacteraceae bacterium]|jgi:hypothetical protein|nr:hypothetical protein [Chthoniobacteraceae bacterium]